MTLHDALRSALSLRIGLGQAMRVHYELYGDWGMRPASVLISVLRFVTFGLAVPEGAIARCEVSVDAPSPRPSASIEELRAIEDTIEQLRSKHGAEGVLIVFDIDNTLLTAVHDFGSHAWFEWQDALLDRTGCEHLSVADSFAELLEVQYLAYAIGDMRPAESDTAGLVADLVREGHPVMALTAHGPETRGSTLRELRESGIAFPTAPRCRASARNADTICRDRGTIGADTLRKVGETTLPEIDRSLLPDPPRPVSYADGVMMVSGQDKGVMLKLLLASVEGSVHAVVFVDDGAGNVINVERAFSASGTPEARAFWYRALDDETESFLTDPDRLEDAAQAWHQLSSTLCSTVRTFCGP